MKPVPVGFGSPRDGQANNGEAFLFLASGKRSSSAFLMATPIGPSLPAVFTTASRQRLTLFLMNRPNPPSRATLPREAQATTNFVSKTNKAQKKSSSTRKKT